MRRILTALVAVMLISLSGSASGLWQSREGYRGFFDVGGIISVDSWGLDALTVSTTHGCQVVPSYLFVGVGMGFHVHNGSGYLPLYADLRTQLPTGRFSPFFDMRFGYSGRIDGIPFNYGGLYLSPSIGVTWSMSRKIGMELAVGYTFQDAVLANVLIDNVLIGQIRKNIGGLNLRLGITF